MYVSVYLIFLILSFSVTWNIYVSIIFFVIDINTYNCFFDCATTSFIILLDSIDSDVVGDTLDTLAIFLKKRIEKYFIRDTLLNVYLYMFYNYVVLG
jgi:hypothetical protein